MMKNYKIVAVSIYGLQIMLVAFILEIGVYRNGYMFPLVFSFIVYIIGWRCSVCGASPADKRTIGLVWPFFTISFRSCGVCGHENSWQWKLQNYIKSYQPTAEYDDRSIPLPGIRSPLVRIAWVVSWGITLTLVIGFIRVILAN